MLMMRDGPVNVEETKSNVELDVEEETQDSSELLQLQSDIRT